MRPSLEVLIVQLGGNAGALLRAVVRKFAVSYTEQGAYLDGLDSSDSRRAGTTSQLDTLATVLKEQA